MKVYKFMLFLLVLFIFNISYVKAEECDNNYINNLKELANNISYDYEYIGNDDNYQLYNLSFDGVDKELYIRYLGINFYDDYNFDHIESGVKYFDVYSSECFEEKISTITVELPVFNEYSLTGECKEIGDNLDICNKWYQGDISSELYNMELEKYYDSIDNTNEIIDVFYDNYIFIIGFGTLLIILIIILILYKKKKNTLE